MEFERYEDVIDAFEIDNMGYETLTDYIKGNNIRIAEIDMSPMGDLAKAFNKKDGGLMVAVQKFNQGGKAYDPRASVEDMAKAIKTSSAGTDNQKLRMLMDYSMSANPQATPQTVMANQGKMEKLLGLQTNPNFNYMKPSGPALIMPPMESTGFRQDPGYFGNEGIMINGKRYMSEDEAIEDMGIETYNRFMAKGGMAGGKTYHQYHDQFVPPDSESQMYANGGGVGSMMQPKKKKFEMQGDKKPAKNYLGKQKTVSGVPLKWQSGPNTPPTELAYITKKEKDLILKADLHGSLKDGPNTGPDGIMSLDSQGDYTQDRSPNAYGGGSRQSKAQNEKNMRDILTGQKNIGQTAAKGPLTTRYGNTPEYVNVKQPDGTYKQTYVGSAYKSYGQPSFSKNLFSRGASGYRGIKGNPIFGNATKNLQMRDGPLGMGYYSDDETYGETRDKVPFGIMGIIGNILEKFKKPPVDYSNMSEFNKLQNIDGQVIDPTGLELDKGMFGFPVNTNVTNQKPTANITGTNLNDFEIGDPGKYATADALTEANMADYQTSLVDEFTPGGIDRTNLYEDFIDNRDLISETAVSPQFNTSLIDEFGVQDRGTLDANQGLQFGDIPATADQGYGLMNSDAAKAAAMSVMSNAFNQNVNPGTSDMGFPDRNMNFPDTGEVTASLPGNNMMAFRPGSIKDRQLKQAYGIYEATGMEPPNLKSLMQEDLESGGELSLDKSAYSLIG